MRQSTFRWLRYSGTGPRASDRDDEHPRRRHPSAGLGGADPLGPGGTRGPPGGEGLAGVRATARGGHRGPDAPSGSPQISVGPRRHAHARRGPRPGRHRVRAGPRLPVVDPEELPRGQRHDRRHAGRGFLVRAMLGRRGLPAGEQRARALHGGGRGLQRDHPPPGSRNEDPLGSEARSSSGLRHALGRMDGPPSRDGRAVGSPRPPRRARVLVLVREMGDRERDGFDHPELGSPSSGEHPRLRRGKRSERKVLSLLEGGGWGGRDQ